MNKLMSFVMILILIIAGLMAFDTLVGQRAVLNMKIGNIDLGKYADGVYKGIYEYYRWSNEVSVNLEDHKITDIDVRSRNDLPKGIIEKIKDEIIDNQSLDVDTVSGATVSSKTILKAIENAFKNGLVK